MRANHNPYCNEIILDLVEKCFLSDTQARKITAHQFESSALSEQYVLNLVYQRKISVVRALLISRESYLHSALSYYRIQILVERGIMSINRALSIARDEVANPVMYLTELEERRTPEQNRKLQLYETEPDITPDYVEHIVSLEFQKGGRDPTEDRELELLLDPGLRRYAIHIVNLEFFSEEDDITHRELELIFSRYSRAYAELIVHLEFNKNKTVDDEIYLENLYLRVCCKLPRKNPVFSLFQSLLHEDIGPQGCREQVFFRSGCNLSMIQHDASERRQMEQMKAVIERAAKDIVMVELDVRGVPVRLRETEAMRQYVFIKTDLLRHALMKYFVGASFPYSKMALDALKDNISEKLHAKTLTLSESDKLLSLRSWIDAIEQPSESPVLQD